VKKRAGKSRSEGKAAAVQKEAVPKKDSAQDSMPKEFYKCLTSFSYYGKVKGNTAKRALSYFAILLLVFMLLPLIAGFAIVVIGVGALDMPEVRIQGGQAYADVQQPYIIRSNKSETAVIIDTTGQTKDLDAYKTGALLTKDTLIIKQEKQTRIIELSSISDVTINRSFLVKMLIVVLAAVAVFLYILALIWNALYAAFFTLPGLLLNQTFRAGLSHKELWIIGIYALTPLMVFGFLLDLVGISFIFRDTIIYVAYLVGAVSSARKG